MIAIGVTGLISSGKSTVSKILSILLDAKIFDADLCVHNLYEFDCNIINAINKLIPGTYINGKLCRTKILHGLSDNWEIWDKLDTIVHKECNAQLDQFLLQNSNEKYLILDVPLLYKSNTHKKCDFIVGVTSQTYQAKNKNVEMILKRQYQTNMLEDIINKSDFIIKNSDDREHLEFQCELVASEIEKNL